MGCRIVGQQGKGEAIVTNGGRSRRERGETTSKVEPSLIKARFTSLCETTSAGAMQWLVYVKAWERRRNPTYYHKPRNAALLCCFTPPSRVGLNPPLEEARNPWQWGKKPTNQAVSCRPLLPYLPEC